MHITDHRLVYREKDAYCSHPHMVVRADGSLLLAFNRSVRRPMILHPPHDPEYINLVMVSRDGGQSWSEPWAVPCEDIRGVECPGLTATSQGRILLNQWRFHWHSGAEARDDDGAGCLTDPQSLLKSIRDGLDPAGSMAPNDALESIITWARGGGELRVHVSDDGGQTFPRSRLVDTAPYCGGYGMRGAIELPDGGLLLPLCDAPRYRAVFHVLSRDCGESWSAPTPIAEEPGKEFEEPAGLLLSETRILLMLRENTSRVLHSTFSEDAGRTWSRPAPTGIPDYPAQLLHLEDGNIACVAGRRFEPFGIMLHLSRDGGKTWHPGRSVAVRDDLQNPDLGYPTVAKLPTGDLLVVYYAQAHDGVTGLYATTVTAGQNG